MVMGCFDLGNIQWNTLEDTGVEDTNSNILSFNLTPIGLLCLLYEGVSWH